MSNVTRIIERPIGVLRTEPTHVAGIGRAKMKDGWWARKRAELVERKRSVAPIKSPLDRRIERAIKKATETP